jgi:hypothetical protein
MNLLGSGYYAQEQIKQASETAKRPATRSEGGSVDLNLTRDCGMRMVFVSRKS